MLSDDYLKLHQQICHPIYSTANALQRLYKPLLVPLDLTYPQYLIMLALWEKDSVNLNDISERLFFDSGTLTPLIQKLLKKNLIAVKNDEADRRNKIIVLTAKGKRLKSAATAVPRKLSEEIGFSEADINNLMKLVRKLHQVIIYQEKSKISGT